MIKTKKLLQSIKFAAAFFLASLLEECNKQGLRFDVFAAAFYDFRKRVPNASIAVFFTPGKKEQFLVLLDHRGNLWKIELKGKRGQKHPILIVDNTGLK